MLKFALSNKKVEVWITKSKRNKQFLSQLSRFKEENKNDVYVHAEAFSQNVYDTI